MKLKRTEKIRLPLKPAVVDRKKRQEQAIRILFRRMSEAPLLEALNTTGMRSIQGGLRKQVLDKAREGTRCKFTYKAEDWHYEIAYNFKSNMISLFRNGSIFSAHCEGRISSADLVGNNLVTRVHGTVFILGAMPFYGWCDAIVLGGRLYNCKGKCVKRDFGTVLVREAGTDEIIVGHSIRK